MKFNHPSFKKIFAIQYPMATVINGLCFVFLCIPYSVRASEIKPETTPSIRKPAASLSNISDDEWRKIAGAKLNQNYLIVKGDTLATVSAKLFGKSKYWRKIWELNRDRVPDPAKLKAGTMLTFLPSASSSEETPTSIPVADPGEIIANDLYQNVSNALVNARKGHHIRSKEWELLPKQSWESYKPVLPPEIDPLGFDKRNKVAFRKVIGFETFALPATDKLKFLGQIIGGRSEGNSLSFNDIVYIRADDTLQTGETYAITSEPNLLKSRKSDRIGYSYIILGKVKILGVRDNLFIGLITAAKDDIPRGTSLIAVPPKVTNVTPIPGPRAIQGVLMFDHRFSTFTSAQFKEVFVDRGSDDGVKPGMVFRAYEHLDPATDMKLTASDFIIDADILITHVSEIFSLGVVLSNRVPLMENSTVTLLTDISDLHKNEGFREKGPHADELDDLDQMDQQGGMGRAEKKELKQLEDWKSNPPIPEIAPRPPSEDTAGNPPPPPNEAMPEGTPPSTITPAPDAPPPPPSGAGNDTPPPPPSGAGNDTTPPPPGASNDASPPSALPPVTGTLTPPTSTTEAAATSTETPPVANGTEPEAPPPPPAQ